MKKVLPLICLVVAVHASLSAQEFIINVHNFRNQVAGSTMSAAVIGDKLYMAWGGDRSTLAIIAVSPDGGKTISDVYRSRTDGYGEPTIAAYNNKLYLAFTGADRSLNLMRVVLNDHGIPVDLVEKRISVQTSDVGPILFSTSTGLFIMWRGRNPNAPQPNIATVNVQ